MTDRPDEPRDPAIERIADALRPLPAVDPEAKARVLIAVAAERAAVAERPVRRAGRPRFAIVAGIAASLVVAFGSWRYAATHPTAPAAAVVQASPAETAVALAADAGEAAELAVQLVLRAPEAERVAVVGDFTGWDDGRIMMVRDSASGLWSATVRVRPGRHVYAFVLDDTLWLRDPRAPIATDADFGRPGSLLLVGRP